MNYLLILAFDYCLFLNNRFIFPFFEGDNDTLICGAAKLDCYSDSVDKLLENYVDSVHNGETMNEMCNCLPSCTSITYDVEVSQTKFDWENYMPKVTENASDSHLY